MNGNTRSIVVRLTPKQAVYAAALLRRVSRSIEWRAGLNIEDGLRDAGWRYDGKAKAWGCVAALAPEPEKKPDKELAQLYADIESLDMDD